MAGPLDDIDAAVTLIVSRKARGDDASAFVEYLRGLLEQAAAAPGFEEKLLSHGGLEVNGGLAVLYECDGNRVAAIRHREAEIRGIERLHQAAETDSFMREFWGNRDPSGLGRCQRVLREFVRTETPTWSILNAYPLPPLPGPISETADHFEVIQYGLHLHDDRRYAGALLRFEQAASQCPSCPSAQYNKANTLHSLDLHDQAFKTFQGFVSTPEDVLLAGCPDMAETPRSLCLDALNMMFVTTLYATRSWENSIPHLRKHLQQRARGLRSIWSKDEIISEADEMREEFCPDAQPVRDWVL
jgi:tetratricopeptide (TPR) repeat protein